MTPCRELTHNGKGRGASSYSRATLDGKRVTLHRWIVEQVEGPLLPGEVVRHKCDNPPCFLYDHLERGTIADNNRDMRERQGHWESRKTHCPQNHPYDEANTLRSSGQRLCRICKRDGERRRAQTQKTQES